MVGSFVGLGEGTEDGFELGEGLGIMDGLGLGATYVGWKVGLGDGINDGLGLGIGVVGSLVGLGEGIKDGDGEGNGVGDWVGPQVVQDNVNILSIPPTVEPPEYSDQVRVESGGVFSQSASISSKTTEVPSPSIAQLTVEG